MEDLIFERGGQTFWVRLRQVNDGWRAEVFDENGTIPLGVTVTATSETLDDMLAVQGVEPLPLQILQKAARDIFLSGWPDTRVV